MANFNAHQEVMIQQQPTQQDLPIQARWLGLAGLLPQSIFVLMAFYPAQKYIGLAAGYFYASLIVSFLGGIYWGVVISRQNVPRWIFIAAVAPSLLAFATGIPWMIGTSWPGPSLVILSIALVCSLLVDRRLKHLGLISDALFSLRVQLSFGLGALTLGLALLA
jgi:Protein of unknown function (DUF3429)